MVVELALPALLPGFVALHYRSDRKAPMGYVVAAAYPGLSAACWPAAAYYGARDRLDGSDRSSGIALAVLAFALIGVGVSASGTSLLVLLAKRVAASRRASAATLVWLMMIVGFAVTAGTVGRLLDPYSPLRLVVITAVVCVLALAITVIAIRGLEQAGVGRAHAQAATPHASAPRPSFKEAISQVWDEPVARRFSVFIFVSMLAYSAQDLILEPFAGAVFGFTPGESTSLSGLQHGGVLAGMIAATLAGRGRDGRRFGSLRAWQVGGCLVSAVMLLGLVAAGFIGPAWPFRSTVFGLGVANGAFSIAAIASMMRLANEGRHAREGVRMGLWGAAQAIAFGLGGLVGTAASDLARWLIGSPGAAYAAVFAFEALLFVLSALLAARLTRVSATSPPAVSRVSSSEPAFTPVEAR
jgi:BCD family chlorophyll transporter-like MFS transporter